MFTTHHVRAGACTQGNVATAPLVACALEAQACPMGTTYWSSLQLYQNIVNSQPGFTVSAADCLTADETNRLVYAYCPEFTSTVHVGACFVQDTNVYQCATSENACDDNAEYVGSAVVMANVNIMCEVCGMTSEVDGDFSDLMPITADSAPAATASPTNETSPENGLDFGASTESPTSSVDPTLGMNETDTNSTLPGSTDPTLPGTDPTLPNDLPTGPPSGADKDSVDEDEYYQSEDGADGDYYQSEDYNESNDNTESSDSSDSLYKTRSGDEKNSTKWDQYKDEFEHLEEKEKLEAAAIFGIAVGALVGMCLGCLLLLWFQRCMRKYCGASQGIDKNHQGRRLVGEDMGHVTDDDDMEDRML